MNSLERDARRISGTTLLAVYVVVGQVLGMSLGGLKASRELQTHTSIHSLVYAPDSDPNGHDGEDADERDPFRGLAPSRSGDGNHRRRERDADPSGRTSRAKRAPSCRLTDRERPSPRARVVADVVQRCAPR